MVRFAGAFIAGWLLLPAALHAADAPSVAGVWKITVTEQNATTPFWLLTLESKDGKWTGTVVQNPRLRFPKPTLEKISATNDVLRFALRSGGDSLGFEVKVPTDAADRMYGNVQLGNNLLAVRLDRTKLTSLDPYELNKETVARPPGDVEVLNAALELLEQAAEKKAKPEEVRGWADKAVKTAELHGPRYHRNTLLGVAERLTGQEGFAAVAVTYARQAERLLDPKEKARDQKRVLDVLAAALEKAGKADDAKEVQARVKKLDLSFKPEPFAGRKGDGDRVVVVELFTGAECPPCVAADLAFDALGKAFKPGEAVLLQYHLHIPGPDPLTSPASVSRSRFYGRAIEGTPTLLLNGNAKVPVGGGADDAEERYDAVVGTLTPLLEKRAPLKLKATATRKGDKIDISAEATDVANPSEDLRLRLALVEETVSYTGGNKIASHHHVVRAFPGGTEGTILKEKTGKKTASVDVEELRKELKEYLDKFAEKAPFPNKDRPLELKHLKVIAFVQDDDSGEILQAVQVEVKEAK